MDGTDWYGWELPVQLLIGFFALLGLGEIWRRIRKNSAPIRTERLIEQMMQRCNGDEDCLYDVQLAVVVYNKIKKLKRKAEWTEYHEDIVNCALQNRISPDVFEMIIELAWCNSFIGLGLHGRLCNVKDEVLAAITRRQ